MCVCFVFKQARIDELGKQGGAGMGLHANLLRGELIEKRLEEKKNGEVKAAKARATAKRRGNKGEQEESRSRAIDESWEAPTEVITSARHYRPPQKSALQPPWDWVGPAPEDEEEEAVAATRIQAIQRGRISRRSGRGTALKGIEDEVARELDDDTLAKELTLSFPERAVEEEKEKQHPKGGAGSARSRKREQLRERQESGTGGRDGVHGKRASPKQQKQLMDPYTHTLKKRQVAAAARGRRTGGLFAEERAMEARQRLLAGKYADFVLKCLHFVLKMFDFVSSRGAHGGCGACFSIVLWCFLSFCAVFVQKLM